MGDHATGVEEDEPREEVRRQRQVVEPGHAAHPVARVQRDQQLHHVHLVAQVEMHGRFVEDEHAWRLREGHGEHDELPLTLGGASQVAPAEEGALPVGKADSSYSPTKPYQTPRFYTN